MPTAAFTVTAANDDYIAARSDTYPPTLSDTISRAPADSYCFPARSKEGVSPIYRIQCALMKWDTSSLPDTAVVTGATLRFSNEFAADDGDARNITGDWYVWVNTNADWSQTALTTAFSVDLTTVAAVGSRDITLSNARDNVSVTGTTGLRLHIDGVQPNFANAPYIASGNHATLDKPQLIVDYYTVDPRLHAGYDMTSDETGGNAARILNADPASSDYGLVIRREELNQGNNLLHYYGQAINPGVTSETAVTLTPVRDFTAGTPATTHSVATGKTMRITNVNGAVWRSTTTTSPTANLQLRIRANTSGTATTSSPIVFSAMLAWGEATTATTVLNMGSIPFNFEIPEGVELPSGTSFMLTIADITGATLSRITNEVSMNAFEY